MAHHFTSMEEEDKDEEDAEEHLPTVSLDDDVWMEEPVLERHLCIHENSQYDLCSYPCPHSLNQLHLTPNDTPQYRDLSNFWCHNNCQWQRYSQSGRYSQTLKNTNNDLQIFFWGKDAIMNNETDHDTILINCDKLCANVDMHMNSF